MVNKQTRLKHSCLGDSRAFSTFKNSPGFNAKRTLGDRKSLPPAPPAVVQEVYTFLQPDSAENIVFTGESVNGKPQIKCGSLEKLVQRLTHETLLGLFFSH